jgi:hypothetical protein
MDTGVFATQLTAGDVSVSDAGIESIEALFDADDAETLFLEFLAFFFDAALETDCLCSDSGLVLLVLLEKTGSVGRLDDSTCGKGVNRLDAGNDDGICKQRTTHACATHESQLYQFRHK